MLGKIKFVNKSVSDNSAGRLDHCDVIGSCGGFGVPTGVPRSEVELQTEFAAVICSSLFGTNHKPTHGLNTWRHMHQIQQVSLCPSFSTILAIHLFKYIEGDNAHWISRNEMAATAVQWELCGTNFRENIANLWVSCYDGNNDRSARGQGELLRQNPRNFLKKLLTQFISYLACLLTPIHFRVPSLIFDPLVAKYLVENRVSWTLIFLDEVSSDHSGGILSPFMGTAC